MKLGVFTVLYNEKPLEEVPSTLPAWATTWSSWLPGAPATTSTSTRC